jgi:hypothetical protein
MFGEEIQVLVKDLLLRHNIEALMSQHVAAIINHHIRSYPTVQHCYTSDKTRD